MKISIGAQTKIVHAIVPSENSAELLGRYISFADSAKICVMAMINQTTATPVKLSLWQAKDNAGTDAKEIKNDAVIWANEDAGTLDYCTKQENAKDFTTNEEVKEKVIVMEIQPSVLDEGFKYVAVKADASDAGNMVCAAYLIPCLRYAASEALNVIE